MLNGALIIDKPAGMSSAQVVGRLKQLTGIKKIGHTGTLDPFATGVLICCLNQATRLSRFFLHGYKTYEAEMILGTETDTLDATGEVIRSVPEMDVKQTALEAVLARFRGAIQQRPPVYSALKHNGVPLYKLARQGKPVEKPARNVIIETLRLLDMQLPKVVLKVRCSGGTYIRSLCADIGTQLGCGAYLKHLRRTESSGFGIHDAVTLAETEKLALSGNLSDKVVPPAKMLGGMTRVVADAALTHAIHHGRKVTTAEIPAAKIQNAANGSQGPYNGYLMVVDTSDCLLAVLEKPVEVDAYRYCCVFHAPA